MGMLRVTEAMFVRVFVKVTERRMSMMRVAKPQSATSN